LGVVVLVVAGVGTAAAMKPDDYKVERSITIAAPANKPYALVVDFHGWKQWSPCEQLDADMKKTYEGAAKGKGAIYTWSGKNAGDGRMEIVKAEEPSTIEIALHFIKPFEDDAPTTFTFVPEGDTTKVTWTMRGKHNAMSKVMCVFTSMDAMIGGDFEKGLKDLKAKSEAKT
jgi:uncharacterized protein YndB with AHSA1/START domain